MYIPDLFGAYIKGRELAIEKNWQDLKNYENVQNARLQNDLTALDLLGRRSDFAGNRAVHNYQVNSASRADRIGEIAQPGMEAKANMGSGHAQDQFSIWQANRDYGREVMNRGYQSGLAMMDTAGQNKAGQANYWLTDNRAYQHGGNVAQQAYDTGRGNSVTAAHYPTVAQQQNTQGDLQYRNNVAGINLGYDQVKNAHELAPIQHQLAKTNLGNQQADASNYQPRQSAVQATQMQQQEFDRHRLIAELMNAQTPGSGTTYLMGVMGIGGQTATPAQATPAQATPAQATPTTGQTQSSVPVGTNSVLAPTGTPQTNQPVQDIRSLLPPMSQNPNVWSTYQQAANYTGP
jgi:hypothetical protein